MTDEVQLALAPVASAAAVLALTPVAIRGARAAAFYDHPLGYKGHAASTPYLGGAAVVAAFLAAALLFADPGRFAPILVGAVTLCVVGTLDDRHGLSPGLRIAASAAAGLALVAGDLGWALTGDALVDGALTVAWVVGLVNAFNLMDNMDGTMSAVAVASAAGIALVAVVHDDWALAALTLALVGACIGFLRYNLARPAARVFLGDGGSMPTGFVLAAAVMALPLDEAHGISALVPASLLVGVVLFDTALVVVSRRRRRAKLMSGARDHITHRLQAALRSAPAVSLALGATQLALCAAALALDHVEGVGAVVVVAMCGAAGLAAIAFFERAEWLAGPSVHAPRDDRHRGRVRERLRHATREVT